MDCHAVYNPKLVSEQNQTEYIKMDQFDIRYDCMFSFIITQSKLLNHNIGLRLKYLNEFGLAGSAMRL